MELKWIFFVKNQYLIILKVCGNICFVRPIKHQVLYLIFEIFCVELEKSVCNYLLSVTLPEVTC